MLQTSSLCENRHSLPRGQLPRLFTSKTQAELAATPPCHSGQGSSPRLLPEFGINVMRAPHPPWPRSRRAEGTRGRTYRCRRRATRGCLRLRRVHIRAPQPRRPRGRLRFPLFAARARSVPSARLALQILKTRWQVGEIPSVVSQKLSIVFSSPTGSTMQGKPCLGQSRYKGSDAATSSSCFRYSDTIPRKSWSPQACSIANSHCVRPV